jgi:histidinol-phosphate aminotransferase
MIPLDRNENYWLLDDELLSACKQYGTDALATYPHYDQLRSALASYAGVDASSIILTPGSDAAIQELARAYAGGGKKALLPVPTFYGYESVLERVGAHVIPVAYGEEEGVFRFPIEETCRLLTAERPDVLFLCNPNNPLGSPIPDADLERLRVATLESETLLVVDEAYYEYSGRTLIDTFNDSPNLVILRTMSKGFGIPGARIGYCIAHAEVKEMLGKLMLPWPVAHTSVYAALALLERVAAVSARREETIREREHFSDELKKLPGFVVHPSETNFLLIHVDDAAQIAAKLASHGVAVATGDWMSRYPEAKKLLDSTLRIATPSPTDREQVLDILRNI